eukprot:1628507-Lingulodinium_polyedra.AAC.1
MAHWFSLDFEAAAGAWGVQTVWDPDLQQEVPVGADEPLWACFGALPMGWSWALYLCHGSLAEASRLAQLDCGQGEQLIADREPTVVLSPSTARVAPYVDNGNV